MNGTEIVVLALLLLLAAIISTVFYARREQDEFKRWLKEGRWKYEKFRH